MAFHNHVGSLPGVFMIVYLLVQIDLTGAAFHEYLTTDHVLWTEPIAYLGFLFVPFLLQAFAIDEKEKRIKEDKRRVLVTALSINSPKELQRFKNCDFDREKIIESIQNERKDDHKKQAIWNWTSFDKAFRKYPRLNTIVFLIDNNVKEQLAAYNQLNNYEDILQTYLDVTGSKLKRALVKKEIYLDNINDFDIMYDEVKPVIEGTLAKYEDKEIVFNISPGPATVTATLVFLSVKGKRGFCYLEQKEHGAQLKEFYVSAYDLKELWSDIIEKL